MYPTERQRDVLAFASVTAFAGVMYAVPSEWIAWAAPLRLALVTSALAAGLMVLGRIGAGAPLFLDGLRGAALIGFVGLAAASITWSVNPAESRATVVDLLKLMAIYLTLVNVVTTPRRLVIFCGVMVLASSVTSIGVISWWRGGVELVEGYRARWLGVYSDPNHMAMNMAIVIPLAVAFAVRRRSGWLIRLACAAAGVLALIALVLSHSRGGFLGLGCAVAVWAFWERQRMRAVGVALALAVGLALFAPQSFWERTGTVSEFHRDASAMGRVHAWQVASRMSLDRPLLGVGVGGFRYAWPQYAPPEATRAYVAHNIFLDIIGELGFIGLLLFLIFAGGASGGAFLAAASRGEVAWIARAISAAVAGYLVCDLFSGYIRSSHLYVLFGLAACAERIARWEAAARVKQAERGAGQQAAA